MARLVIAFLEALGPDDVTLVGNDTGGALCQFLVDTDPSRIGRVVLTNCDAFDEFPPAPFGLLVKAEVEGGRTFLPLDEPVRVAHDPRSVLRISLISAVYRPRRTAAGTALLGVAPGYQACPAT